MQGLPKTVGGGAVHADMKYPRFQETDFRLGSLLGDVPGANFADWPLTYDELEPFYTEVEEIVGVQGDIAVFSHGHFLRVLAARWLGLAPTAGGMLLLDTGTISVLSTERESPAIRLWNGLPPITT